MNSKDGAAALRKGIPLEAALKVSIGEERLLREALVAAEQNLKEAKGLIVNGYTGDPDLLKRAKSISALAASVFAEMERTPQQT